jgi:hypothetical protein
MQCASVRSVDDNTCYVSSSAAVPVQQQVCFLHSYRVLGPRNRRSCVTSRDRLAAPHHKPQTGSHMWNQSSHSCGGSRAASPRTHARVEYVTVWPTSMASSTHYPSKRAEQVSQHTREIGGNYCKRFRPLTMPPSHFPAIAVRSVEHAIHAVRIAGSG